MGVNTTRFPVIWSLKMDRKGLPKWTEFLSDDELQATYDRELEINGMIADKTYLCPKCHSSEVLLTVINPPPARCQCRKCLTYFMSEPPYEIKEPHEPG